MGAGRNEPRCLPPRGTPAARRGRRFPPAGRARAALRAEGASPAARRRWRADGRSPPCRGGEGRSGERRSRRALGGSGRYRRATVAAAVTGWRWAGSGVSGAARHRTAPHRIAPRGRAKAAAGPGPRAAAAGGRALARWALLAVGAEWSGGRQPGGFPRASLLCPRVCLCRSRLTAEPNRFSPSRAVLLRLPPQRHEHAGT